MEGTEAKVGKVIRERDAEVAREAILKAAEEVFAREGFAGARIDTIAAESGYNKSLIFHYFGGKEGLYLAFFHCIATLNKRSKRLQVMLLQALFELPDRSQIEALFPSKVMKNETLIIARLSRNRINACTIKTFASKNHLSGLQNGFSRNLSVTLTHNFAHQCFLSSHY